MNHSFKKYQAKPEGEQQLHLRKSNKKLLQNFLLNGDGDKDDVIVRKIIEQTQQVPFTEANATKITELYTKISLAKRNLFKDTPPKFATTLLKKKDGEGMEERVPTKDDKVPPLPTHTIEMRKEAYAAYKGAVLYLAKKEEIRKLLKRSFLNGVRSDEAIKAFHLLEKCGHLYTDLFFRDHPKEAGKLTDNLPVEFRQQRKIAFQRGFTRYNYEEQDKKTIEAGKKDPSKYKAPKVTRDNKAELFKTIQEALDKEEEMSHVKEQDIKTNNPSDPNGIAPHSSSGIELYLAIAVDAGLEDKVLQDMLNSATIRSDRRNQLKAKYPTAFNPALIEKNDRSLVGDDVKKGMNNRSNTGLGLSILGTLASAGVGLLTGKHRLKRIKLLALQRGMAGTLGGLKLDTDRDEEFDPKDYQKWLGSLGEGAEKALNTSNKADKRDLKRAGRLKPNQLNVSFDLRKKKKGKKGEGQQNQVKAFLNALPFDSLNYISGDGAYISDEGVIKHLFARINWDATRGEAQAKSQLANVKIYLKEVLFNNFRMVSFKDTYGFGKIHVQDIEIDLKQVLDEAGGKFAALGGLYDLLMNPTTFTSAIIFHLIARFQGREAMGVTKEAMLVELNKMPMDFTSLTIKLGKVTLENFYGNTMGRIGKIGLGSTTLEVKSQQKPDENSDDKYTSPLKKAQQEKAKLDEVRDDKLPALASEIVKLERELYELNNNTGTYYDSSANKVVENTNYRNDLEKLIHTKKGLYASMKAQNTEELQKLELKIKELETNLDKHNEGLKYAIKLSTKDKVQMKDAQLLQDMMREMLLSGMKDSGLTLEGLEGLTDIELPKGLTLGALASANAVKDMTLDVPKISIPNTLKADRFQYDMQVADGYGGVKKDIKGNEIVNLRAIGTNVSIERITLEVNVAFNDLEVNAKEKKDEGMIKNLVINNLSAKSFKFDKFWLKMPEPRPLEDKHRDNNDKKKHNHGEDNLDYIQKLDDAIFISTPSEVKDIKVGFNMNEKSFSLNFEKLIAQKDKNIQIDSKFASKDESSALDEKSQLLLQKVEGLKFGMDKDGKMTAIVGNVTVPQIVLQQFGFKNETIAISHNQDENRNTKTSIKEVTLQNLEFVMDKQGYHIKKLDKLSIAEVLLSGKVTYKGDTIPLNNGSIQGIEATNLKIDIEKGKSILEMVQQGSASIEKINLPKIVYGTVGHLDLFDIGKIKVDRITEKGKEGIDYSVGSIKVRGGSKVKGKDISGGLSTSVGGKYTENKDKEGSISTTLTNTKVDAEVKNKQGKKEMAAKLSAQTISLDTDMTNYATLSLGAALNLDHIFYEAADGTYVKNVPGGAPLQLINPRAKVTFVKEKVKNKKGVEELKTVAYKVEYFNIGKIVGRNLEAGNLTTGKKLLEANDQQLSLENLHVSGIYHTSGKAFTVNASTGQFKLTELKSDLVSKFKLNASLKSTSISFTQKESGGKHLKVKLNQMEVGTANEDKTIEGKLKTDNITFESDLSNYATLSLGKALELSKLHYEDKKGSYIKTLEPNKSPVKLVKPVARLKMIKNKQNKVEAYKLEYLNIEKITAGNLEIHQESTPEKKPGDLLTPKTTKTTLKLSGEEEVTLSKIHLEGKIETGNNDFEIKAEADSFDLKKLQVMVENQLRTYTYLSTGKLSYERAMHGDHTAEVNNLDVGLHKQGGKGHEILALGGLGGLKINKQSKDDQISIFKATKIRYGTFGDESFVVLTDPQIGPLVISGRFQDYTTKYFKGVLLNKLIIKGGVKGDLIVRDTPDKLTLESFQDIMITIPEADFAASSLSSLTNFGKDEEMEKALKKKKKEDARKKREEEWRKIPQPEPIKQDGVRQPIITPKLTAEELYKHSLAGRAEAYQFLNTFGGSHLTIRLLEKVIDLHVSPPNAKGLPTIKLMDFIKEFVDVTYEYFIDLFVGSTAKGLAMDIKPEIMKEGMDGLKSAFESDFKGVFGSDGSIALAHFAVISEEIAEHPAKYINGIIDSAWSAYTDRLLKEKKDKDKKDKKKKDEGIPIERIPAKILSEGAKHAVMLAIELSLSSDGSDKDEVSSRIVPEIVDKILENLNLELVLNAQVKRGNNKAMKKFDSDLEPGGFQGHSTVMLKFLKEEAKNDQGYQINTDISIFNTNFTGFGFPIESPKGNGKISTREMNISKLSVKKQSFEDAGEITIKAKNIYLKGLQLEFNKKKDTPKNKKGN